MSLPPIDTHEFTRRGDVAQASAPLADLVRLGTLLVSHDGALVWRLTGRSTVGADGSRRGFLHLDLEGTLHVRCVRCLEPMQVALDVARDYRLVATEEQAEREDLGDDEVDLLVGARRFDLAGLIEDEAIMGLPAAPRHADCSAPTVAAADGSARRVDAAPSTGSTSGEGDLRRSSGAPSDPAAPSERVRPFAALAGLRERVRPAADDGPAASDEGPGASDDADAARPPRGRPPDAR